MSGHSKWHSIKHKKAAVDAKRGKLFSKIIREIQVAARVGGGDTNTNPRLRKAVTEAKSNGMAADTIKRAIQRGTGELEGTDYEEILYEGTGPGGTLFLIEVMTDNKNRTVAELRKLLEKHGGSLGSSGSAQWAFDRKGIITIAREDATEEQLMEVAVGAGAEDYSDEGEEWQVLTDTGDMDTVVSALEEEKIEPSSNEVGYVPKSKKPLSGREAEKCLNMFEALDDHDDCQNVYADFDISDEELARITGE
ncbi:MAG: YebC/PmpR family DNA-binding transcriptional regulator [Deltaproteobacteria bacterium]|jgi:YebC/PmpR family DNA-binding regulatory protein|nr:YebC/PmpR family DNA-binding transcriptional regulator [Deltaproteobacteria bacterium]MBW2536242.1 YebC/PmpR family DNA-binding transcriptional regulator [Deltaproteobacteria bacterium]